MLVSELTQPSSVLLGLILSEGGSHVAQASLVFPTLLRLPSISGLTSISQGYRNVNSLKLPSFYQVLCMYFFFNPRFSLSLNSVFEGLSHGRQRACGQLFHSLPWHLDPYLKHCFKEYFLHCEWAVTGYTETQVEGTHPSLSGSCGQVTRLSQQTQPGKMCLL